MAVTGCLFGVAVEFVLFLGGLILWGALNMPTIGLLLVTLGVFLPIIGIIWGRKVTEKKAASPPEIFLAVSAR